MRNIFLFQSIRKVMQAERFAKISNVRMKIMPVPGQLSSECGMCIELKDDKVHDMKQLLTDKKIHFQYEQIK